MIDIIIPTVGESINEVTLVEWLKPEGSWVERDEILAELESEKATFELRAEKAGIVSYVAQNGATLKIGDLACKIDDGAERPSSMTPVIEDKSNILTSVPEKHEKSKTNESAEENKIATPLANIMMQENNIKPTEVKGSGYNGKILKNDIINILNNPGQKPETIANSRLERKEKMSNLRRTISRRLVEAKNTTAMLTTFNEVDMSNIMALRNKYKDQFKTTHNVGLGFMSFFTKACTFALQEWPSVNAYIDENEILFHDYCDISIAVSTPKGLVVPVIRNAESLTMAGIEKEVVNLATKARDGKLTIEEMTGGTFTITNGGVFGSLLSTPIINIPQSAILGMHKIQERPMAINGKVEIKPMMYLALSYDHRIIDGKESVGFLVRIKELIENPELLIFGKDPITALLEI